VCKLAAVGQMIHKYDEIICSIHQGGHPASHHDPPVGGPWWGSFAKTTEDPLKCRDISTTVAQMDSRCKVCCDGNLELPGLSLTSRIRNKHPGSRRSDAYDSGAAAVASWLGSTLKAEWMP